MIVRLVERARDALTPYRRVDDAGRSPAWGDSSWFPLAAPSGSALAAEVFEDDSRLIVRIEAPGMQAGDFNLRVHGDRLAVSGHKRFPREGADATSHLPECAYGSFERILKLPAAVRADEARATYRRGVLRIELPKLRTKKLRKVAVKVK